MRVKKEEEEQEGWVRVAPNMGARGSHSQAISDPTEKEGEEEATEGEQQRNEERGENLRLLKGWRESETSAIVRWEGRSTSTKKGKRSHRKKVRRKKQKAHGCRAGGAEEPRGEGGRAEAGKEWDANREMRGWRRV